MKRRLRSDLVVAIRLAGVLLVALATPVLQAAEPPSFRPPSPVLRKLGNGLTVAVFQRSRVPIVQMQLLVPAGTGDDPAEFGGTAHMTAEMLRQGTVSRDAEAFAQQVDRLGGSLIASASRDYSTIEARFLARDFAAGLELMSDAVINPLLADENLQRVKMETFSALARILQDPGNLADEQIWLTVFKGPPYGRTPYGTPESLRKLTSEQLRTFYFTHYRPGDATLAIAGDVTPERAFAAAEEWFGQWTGKGTPPPATTRAPASSPGVRIRLVDAPGQRTQLRLGMPAPPRGSADELAFSLANARFGSGPTSRLADLRERGLLRSEIRSAYVPLKEAGLLLCGTATENDSVGATVQMLQAELRRLVTQPPDETELAPIRHSATSVYPMQFETLGGILGHWSGIHFYGLAESGAFAERVGAVSAADVANAVRRWIRPEEIAIVAIGPAAEIRAQLETFGKVELVGLDGAPIAPPASISVEPSAPATPALVARGRQIVKQAVAAHGGLQRLRGIKDSTVEADATLAMGEQKVAGKFVQMRKEPDRMLFSTSFASFVSQQVLNGDRAWSIAGTEGIERSLDSLGLAGMRSGFNSDLPHLLLAASSSNAQVVSRGREKIGDRDADKVEVNSGRDHRMLYFDATTHRLLAMDQHEARQSRGTFMARRLYRDFRPVNGIAWPHVEERLMDGEPVMILNIKKVVLNAGLDDAIFEKAEAPLLPPAR